MTADHSASVVSKLAEVIDVEIWRNRGYYGHDSNGIDDHLTGESLDQHPSAMPAAQAFIDGPLSDLSVLVQIPKVREAIELLAMLSAAAVFSPLYPQHGGDEWGTLDLWLKALS